MINSKIISFLNIFFELLGERLLKYKILDNIITGTVTGLNDPDENYEDHQDFLWKVELGVSELMELRPLCEYLINNNLIIGDKIKISEELLIKRLNEIGWDIEEAQRNIDNLLSIEMKMIDDGEETDSFFLHL